MSSYYIALIDIHDRERYEQYLDGYDEVFARYKGEVVAVDTEPRVLEGNWPARRTVVIRFPNDEEARRWYDSPEYQELLAHRQAAADCRVAIISGRD
jgi:uncharacterized protein (DUF1330 family)